MRFLLEQNEKILNIINKQSIKHSNAENFKPYIFDFIKNNLIKDNDYLSKLDSVLNSQLSQMIYKNRIEKFDFIMQSESNATLTLFFTYSYLANVYKTSRKMDLIHERKIVPIIEKMF